MALAAVGLRIYVDTIKHFKKARIGPIKQNAPATRTLRSSPCGWANGIASAKADRENARTDLMNSIVFAIGWTGEVEVGDW
jgi:hypothetical protein